MCLIVTAKNCIKNYRWTRSRQGAAKNRSHSIDKMKMKRILQNFRKGSGRGELLGTSDLTGRESRPVQAEDEEEDDDTSLYTTTTTHNQQLEVEFHFSEDKKGGNKESTLSETTTSASELSHSKMTSSEPQHAAFTPKMPQAPITNETITEHPPQQQYPPDRYAETRDLVKKFIADIWNRGELDLIPSVCSPSLRCNGNNGAFMTRLYSLS